MSNRFCSGLFFSLIIIFILTLNPHLGNSAENEIPAFVSAASASPVKCQISETSSKLQLSFEIKGLTSTVSSEGVRWRIENEGIIGCEDAPDLPAVCRWVRLPDKGGIHLTYDIRSQQRFKGSPPAMYRNESGRDDLSRPRRLKSALPVELSEPMLMRGVRMALLKLYPLSWDESTQEYVRINSFSVNIETDASPGENEVETQVRQPSQGFDRLIEALLLNPPARDESDQLYPPGGYLVVCDQDIAQEASEFVEWKRRAGHPTELRTFAAGINGPQLKALIQERYNDTGFEFLVMLGNDEAEAPLRLPLSENNNQFYDVFFAQLEGNDMLPDVAVGTFNCLTLPNLICALRRAISYQSDPYFEETDWFTRAGVGVGACSVPDDLSPSYTGKWVAEVLRREGFDEVTSSYFSDNGENDPSRMVEDLYNQRTNFILVRAHEWDLQVNNIEVTGVYPFHFLCSSGTIGSQNSGAFNRAFRQGAPDQMKGPSAGFGHFSSPRTNVANALAGGLMESMFLFDIGSYGWARNYTVANLARVMVEDGVALMPYYYSHWRYYGDPGQGCWVGVPTTLEVNHLNAIAAQDNFFRVHVENTDNEPVTGAQVCLYQPDNFQKTALTDDEGNACFVWDEELEAAPFLVTVTGSGLRPYLGSVGVAQAARWLLRAENVQFNDARNGNGDGVPNPGEVGALSFDLFNRGTEEMAFDLLGLNNFSLTPWAEDNEGVWFHEGGRLNPGEAFQVNDAFELRILPGCPDEEIISNLITAGWDRTSQNFGFNLQVQASKLEIESVQADLTPGGDAQVQIRVGNVGQLGTGQLNARLESTSLFITIRRGGGAYQPIDPGRIADPLGELFLVFADPATIPGTIADFQLFLTGNPGVADTLRFTLPVGQPVPREAFGPDKYGYVALDNDDDNIAWAGAPDYNWVEIAPWMPNPIFQGQALNIVMGEEDDAVLLLDLPFALRYYGREYRQISVCSNGWLAAGDRAFRADLKNQQNWIMPGFDGAFGQIAVFWDRLHWEGRNNGLLQFYDAQNGRFILEWLATVSDNGQLRDNIFQVILFDPEQHRTPTGDSPILFQYHTVNNVQDQVEANSHCTVGIASPEGTDGLTYTYWNEYPPACAPLMAGRAILWTTIAWEERGVVQGRVLRFIDSTAVRGAEITTSTGLQTITGDNGVYRIVGQEPGEFSLTARAERYGQVIAEDLVMEEGGELVQDFVLPHGWLTLPDTAFSPVGNIGNARLACTLNIVYLDTLNIEWLSVDPVEFVLEPGSEGDLVLTLNQVGLPNGEYEAEIHYLTDDPQVDIIRVYSLRVDGIPDPGSSVPTVFRFYQPYPNPFNSAILLRFDLPQAGLVKMNLFDLSGRSIRTLADDYYPAGNQAVVLDASQLPAGVYLLRLNWGSHRAVQRVVILK